MIEAAGIVWTTEKEKPAEFDPGRGCTSEFSSFEKQGNYQKRTK